MQMSNEWLQPVDQHSFRCWWPGDDVPYQKYHDTEWGRPVHNDQKLFEKLCLEGFQAGLSWLTILRKRENFRIAFHNFDCEVVAAFSDSEIEELMNNAGIVRHRGKIEAVINNAQRAFELNDEVGSLREYFWSFAPKVSYGRDGESQHPSGVASTSPSATRLSKDLKKRGWKFVGPTTMYSFMQSMGLVNDHVEGCWVRDECEELRVAAHKEQ
jgi:DNA-3-methyladenine glycosylase I